MEEVKERIRIKRRRIIRRKKKRKQRQFTGTFQLLTASTILLHLSGIEHNIMYVGI